jgi:hypothetical protein
MGQVLILRLFQILNFKSQQAIVHSLFIWCTVDIKKITPLGGLLIRKRFSLKSLSQMILAPKKELVAANTGNRNLFE